MSALPCSASDDDEASADDGSVFSLPAPPHESVANIEHASTNGFAKLFIYFLFLMVFILFNVFFSNTANRHTNRRQSFRRL